MPPRQVRTVVDALQRVRFEGCGGDGQAGSGECKVKILKVDPAVGGCVLNIGKQGENLARAVEFDITKWQEEYGAGSAQLIVQRNGDESAYHASITERDGIVTWAITSADTAKSGYGSAELLYATDDVTAKGTVLTVYVAPSVKTYDNL